MNVIEKRYRLIGIQEDIQYLESKVAVIDVGDGADRDRLLSASWHLNRAVDILRSISLAHRPGDMTALLQASIDGRKQ